jgi:transposase, IS5 family
MTWLKKNEINLTLRGRCDSFVVETNVHYPTDTNLLFDAIRKVIVFVGRESKQYHLTGWRQYQHNIKSLKKQLRLIQKINKSASGEKDGSKNKKLHDAYSKYVYNVFCFLEKAERTKLDIEKISPSYNPAWILIEQYIADAKKLIDQINRRVFNEEDIPHDEKIFSIFQPHTEWISKGKLKAPVELGLRTCIMEDQFGFILYHCVMEKETDDQVAVDMVRETKKRFKNFIASSFDAGFYSPQNYKILSKETKLTMRKKGKLTKKEKKAANQPKYIERRNQHSAIESAINALEIHGLDKCFDHGIDGFKRYVALAVVARNIQQLGAALHSKKRLRYLQRKAA